MNISLQNIDKVSALLTVQIEKADYEGEVEKSLKNIRKKANIPGFRPGQVPAGLIKKQYGKAVLAEEVNKLLQDKIYEYLRDNKVNMLGEPLPNEEKQQPVDFSTMETFEFVFDIALAPEFKAELSQADTIDYYTIQVDDEMVERQIKSYTQRNGKYEKADSYQDRDMLKGLLAELDEAGNTKEEIVDSKDGLLTTVGWCIGEEVTYALEGSIFTSGSLLQWLRDSLHLFKDVNDTEKIAASVPSSQGVIIVPAFVGMGAPYWKKEARGMIFNLKRDTDYRHIIRAALEAMAYEAKDLIDIMQSASNTIINDLKVDGGASKNNFLLQFQSDILNMNVIRNKVSESTALGAARLAGLAVGFYEFDDFKYDDVEIFRPKMSKEEADKLYEGWLKAVKACVEY